MVSQPTTLQLQQQVAHLMRGDTLSLHETARIAENGLPYPVFTAVQTALGVSTARLGKLAGLSPATLARRKTGGFTPAESDRILRYARVFSAAVAALGHDPDAARGWLDEPALALEGRRPLDHCRTEAGAEEVRSILGAMEHGLYL